VNGEIGRVTDQCDCVACAVSDEAIDEFFDMYANMDEEGTGRVDMDVFYRHFELERSPFSDRVFAVMGVCLCLAHRVVLRSKHCPT
jgi:hypothetical protein